MAEISKKTAQQIVDSVKDVCGHDVNFIQPDGSILASRLSGQKELVLAPEFGVGRCLMKLAPYYCITPCRD